MGFETPKMPTPREEMAKESSPERISDVDSLLKLQAIASDSLFRFNSTVASYIKNKFREGVKGVEMPAGNFEKLKTLYRDKEFMDKLMEYDNLLDSVKFDDEK